MKESDLDISYSKSNKNFFFRIAIVSVVSILWYLIKTSFFTQVHILQTEGEAKAFVFMFFLPLVCLSASLPMFLKYRKLVKEN